MDAPTVDESQVFERARERGFLVLRSPPLGPDRAPIEHRLLDAWRTWCQEQGRHGVWVMPDVVGRWYVLLAFLHGIDNEFEYVVNDFRNVFSRRFRESPQVIGGEPDAWHSAATEPHLAEAAAEEIVAIDRRDRDPAMVVQVHAI